MVSGGTQRRAFPSDGGVGPDATAPRGVSFEA